MQNFNLEIRKIGALGSRNKDQALIQIPNAPAVPDVGEIFNLNGQPYIVRERLWAVNTLPDKPLYDRLTTWWVYVRVEEHST